MIRGIRTATMILAGAALLFSLPAGAQTTTGRVQGQVNDDSGAPLPGVTVTVSSDSLPGGSRLAITGDSGDYRFAALPPGMYKVEAMLDGYRTQAIDGVRVSLGATATADLVLGQEFVEELTVTSEAPLVDVTSAGTSAVYSAEFMENLPTNRNFYDLIAVSPGVSQGLEDSDRQVAFGSNVQSNSWFIDGIETDAPETGSVWVYVNPDAIEEIQVHGIGASAEYGNMMGAVMNVVTKSGTNQLKGGANAYWFDDSLVDSKLHRSGTRYPDYSQGEFWDVTATLGGPILRDRLWFFGAYEYWRDLHTFPGQDPSSPTWFSDRYDLKVTSQITEKNLLEVKGYRDPGWGYPEPGDEFTELSARQGERGDTSAWGLTYQALLSGTTYFEARYSGWQSDDIFTSQTGSTEPAFVDSSPPGGGPTLYTGGAYYPWTYDTSTDQVSLSVSHFADDFLKGDHDFKFGIQANQGDASTKIFLSATGTYYYHYAYTYEAYGYTYTNDYFYRVTGAAYFYGNDQESWSAYADDSWQITDRLTLNLGLRFDHHDGKMPAYPRLDPVGNPTGEVIPGVDMFTWDNVSPRLGFAYNAGADRKTVIRGSFGIYYDGNVGGNWNYPPPDHPGQDFYLSQTPSYDGPYEYDYSFNPGGAIVNQDLETPRTLQYAVGAERQFGKNYSIGLQGMYKETDDLIGWEILDDGVYEELPFTDPFTGRQYTLLDPVVFPTVRKGNRPGFTVDPNVDEYFQEYWAAILTFNRRFADWWGMQASYTYSDSQGVIPRFSEQYQFNPFYSSRKGAHPSSYLNLAGGIPLQGDRPHMLRAQGNFELPWDLHASLAVNLQSGRPYYREIQLPVSGGSFTSRFAIMDSSLRHDFQDLVDVGIGKRFPVGDRFALKLDLQVLNLLNNDATDFFETVVLAEGDEFVPNTWIKPRRLLIRAGFEF